MRAWSSFPAGTPALLVGIALALAGSFADDALGGHAPVVVLQVALWTVGGLLILTGLAASFTLGAGQRVERARSRRGSGRPARTSPR